MATKTTTPERGIEIAMPALEKVIVQIVGDTPLITHRFSEEARQGIEGKQQKRASAGKEARDPEAEWRRGLYEIDADTGTFGFPANGVKKAVVSAGMRFTEMKGTELRGLFHVTGDLLEIEGSEPEMRADRVKIGMGKTTVAYRPMFRSWSIRVPVTFNANLMTTEQLLSLIAHAGFAIGIGDWRPECNGVYGTFSLGEVLA